MLKEKAHFNKTRNTEQLLTLGLPLKNTLQIEGLFRSLKFTLPWAFLAVGPLPEIMVPVLGLQVLFCKYQFFSKLGKFFREKNKTSNLFTEQNENYCCRFQVSSNWNILRDSLNILIYGLR